MRLKRVNPPRMRTIEGESERTATWLELFYDLVFVVGVAVLSQRLGEAHDFWGVLSYLGYFFLLWWLWASHTFYANRFDTDDLAYRLLATVQLAAVAVIAAAVAPGASMNVTAFAVGYTIARCALLVMYWRARRHVAETRVLVTGYLIGFTTGAAIWALSIFVSGSMRFVLWTIAICVDLATPWLMRAEQARAPLDTSHLPERFGLFTILVLGESIAATVLGLRGHSWSAASTVTAVLAIAVAASLWWLYFENVEGQVVRRDPATARTWRPTVWIYSHAGLAAGLGITAIGLEHAIEASAVASFHDFETWLLTGGVALATVCLALTHLASGDARTSRLHNRVAAVRVVAAFGVLAIGLFDLSAVGVVLAIALLLGSTAIVQVPRPGETWSSSANQGD